MSLPSLRIRGTALGGNDYSFFPETGCNPDQPHIHGLLQSVSNSAEEDDFGVVLGRIQIGPQNSKRCVPRPHKNLSLFLVSVLIDLEYAEFSQIH